MSDPMVKLADDMVALRAELEQWKTWGVVEIAVRNPQVAEYCNHWEKRTEKAEAELEQVRQELKEANRISDAFRTKWEEITREVNRLGDERSEERRQSTWEYIRKHYGKVEDWARKELPEPWRTQFFCCLANGTSGVLSSDYFKDSAAEQMFYDQCNRAEASESREKRVREALEKLIVWLDNDTLEIMKDTIKMGITFDWSDCQQLREQIEEARRALEGE